MKKKLSLLIASCIAFASLAQVPYRWDAESSRASAAQITCYRGETIHLQPTFRQYGTLVTNATYTLYWQTNGMGTAYWSTNSLYFTPAMDVGASAYTLFVGAAMSNGVSYRANATMRMLGSPGATPNTLPLPVQSIDFSSVTTTNAFWLLSESDPTLSIHNTNETAHASLLSNYLLSSAWLTWLSTNNYLTATSTNGWTVSAHQAWLTNMQSGVTLSNFTAAGYFTAANGRIELAPFDSNPGDLGVFSFIRRTPERAFHFFDIDLNTLGEYSFLLDPVSESLRWGSEPGRTWTYPAEGANSIIASRAYVASATSGLVRASITNGLASTAWVVTEKELHTDSYTNIIWRSVYSNGWMWLIAYTNYPAQ